MSIPSINGVYTKIYKVITDPTKHKFRERLQDRDKSYDLLKKLLAQPVWYSAEEVRFKEEIMNFSSLGYLIFRAQDLQSLGISPAPDGKDWMDYRLAPKINGSYTNKLLQIVEVRQESPWHQDFTLWYVYFTDVRPEPKGNTTENPLELRGPDDITMVVEKIREY